MVIISSGNTLKVTFECRINDIIIVVIIMFAKIFIIILGS